MDWVNFFIKTELNKNLNVTIVYPTQKISIEIFYVHLKLSLLAF